MKVLRRAVVLEKCLDCDHCETFGFDLEFGDLCNSDDHELGRQSWLWFCYQMILVLAIIVLVYARILCSIVPSLNRG